MSDPGKGIGIGGYGSRNRSARREFTFDNSTVAAVEEEDHLVNHRIVWRVPNTQGYVRLIEGSRHLCFESPAVALNALTHKCMNMIGESVKTRVSPLADSIVYTGGESSLLSLTRRVLGSEGDPLKVQSLFSSAHQDNVLSAVVTIQRLIQYGIPDITGSGGFNLANGSILSFPFALVGPQGRASGEVVFVIAV